MSMTQLDTPITATNDDPRDLAAERALLHALLNGADMHPVRLESVQAGMFYTYAHGWIFDAMVDLNKAGSEIDVITLMNRAKERGELQLLRDDGKSGEDLIRWLKSSDAAPDGSESIRGYAKIIRTKYARRMMIKAAGELAGLALDEVGDPSVQITQFIQALNEHKPFSLDDAFIDGGDAASRHFDILSAKAQYQSYHLPPFQTWVDRGIIMPDDSLVIIIGPEGSGKSSMLAVWAEHSATNGVKTAYITTEMTDNNVLDRAAVRRDKRIRYNELLMPDKISAETWQHITSELENDDPHGGNLHYWHAGSGIAEEKLMSAMQRLADDYGVRVFVIDYINDFTPAQLTTENKTSSWRNMLARIETWCEKNHAMVVTAAQMNKDDGAYEVGKAADQKATLYIEIQVDKTEFEVGYTYDGVNYRVLPGQAHPVHKVVIRKNRHGSGSGTTELLFVGARYMWTDVPRGFGQKDTEIYTGYKD